MVGKEFWVNYPRQHHRVGQDPAHIWYTWIPHSPDVGRIWAETMLLSGVPFNSHI